MTRIRLAALLLLLAMAGCASGSLEPSPAPASTPLSATASATTSTTPVVSAPPTTPSPTPSPTSFGQQTFAPTKTFRPPARVRCPTATVTVRTVAQLTTAVRSAKPGAVILVEAGSYRTRLSLSSRASRQQPIFLCGRGRVLLDGGTPSAGAVLTFRGARYWRLLDLTIRNGVRAVDAGDTDHTILQDLTLTRTGGAGLWWHTGSGDNVLRDSTVAETGMVTPAEGQGVLIGTPATQWCRPGSCQADENDGNLVLATQFRATTGSAVRAYEGSYNGVVYGNRINGAGMTADDAWVDIRGSSWLVARNAGRHSPRDGFRARVAAQGHGESNTFRRNTGRDLDERASGGYLVALRPDRADQVSCDNKVTDRSAPRTNIRCSR